ncbi:PadR family transcriptional regulator [Nonlabens ponticola]|uniref:PadR family transcriptional regulator n=1 Tax=Nonlabens ponticola TaxID=2496866 RepID=A0A3S9MYS3_9FLAO|nr:PadR family transcriptional regulator [Nonlabens ponticola]AZQ44307.1 PadR family transcriptional regulator [Nonlabens ponticola]
MQNTSLFKGNLTTIVLQLLDREGMMYGYEITQKVKEETNGSLEIKEGALYPVLHKLEAQGFLQVEARKVDNRIRKYYKITEAGNEERISQLDALRDYLETMQQLLIPKPI